MSERTTPSAFTSWYVAALVLALAATFAVKLRSHGVFACPARYAGAAYLSDCNAAEYGDYDHGAFYFGLEPSAREAASRAQVLFLGNSRIQFALSAPATTRWFGDRSIPFYSLGFSHYESVTFLTPVLERVKPHPRAVVINADRFFAEWQSPASHRVMDDGAARAAYEAKRNWQKAHEPLCSHLPAACGDAFAVYRMADNGIWVTAGRKPDQRVGVADGPADDTARWPHFIDLAHRFVDTLGVERECLILTIVPNSRTRRAEAEAIAQALGARFVAPSVEGLTTFDGSHLDSRSAALWSSAFLEAAGPLLERCVGVATPLQAKS